MLKVLASGLVGFLTGRIIYKDNTEDGNGDGEQALENQLEKLEKELEKQKLQTRKVLDENTKLKSDLADKTKELEDSKVELEQVKTDKETVTVQLTEISKEYTSFKKMHKGQSCEEGSGENIEPDTGLEGDLDVSNLVFPEVYKYDTDFDSLAELADFAVVYAIGIKNQADQFVFNTTDTAKVSPAGKDHHFKAVFTSKTDSEQITKTLQFYSKEDYDLSTGVLKVKPIRVNHVTYSVLNELDFAKYLFESKIVNLEDGIILKSKNIKAILNDDIAFQEASGAPARIVVALVVSGALHVFKKYGSITRFDQSVNMPGSIANYA